jgi:hypothetical protein
LHKLPAPSGRAGLALVHGDLHPENVILTADGPMVMTGAPDPSAQLRAALERRAADPAISEAERPRLTVAADLIRANLP